MEAFILKSPYGRIVCKLDLTKSIKRKKGEEAVAFIWETVNNDIYSGEMLNKKIPFKVADGEVLQLSRADIQEIVFDVEKGPYAEMRTDILFMKNGDRFSGRIVTEEIGVVSKYSEHKVRGADIQRVEISDTVPAMVEVYQKNGCFIRGELEKDRLEVIPDSANRLSICVCTIDKIQTNAEKLIKKIAGSFPDEHNDTDSDGVTDAQDECPDTPCLVPVNEKGCRLRIE